MDEKNPQIRIISDRIYILSEPERLKKEIFEVLKNSNENKEEVIEKLFENHKKNISIKTHQTAIFERFCNGTNVIEIDTRPEIETYTMQIIEKINRIIPNGFFNIHNKKVVHITNEQGKKIKSMVINLKRKPRYWHYE